MLSYRRQIAKEYFGLDKSTVHGAAFQPPVPLTRRLCRLSLLLGWLVISTHLSRGAVAPVIVTEPAKAVVTVGSNHTFSVTASGTEPLRYQWAFNGNALAGATARDLVLTNVQTNNAGGYHVVVSDVNGSVTSVVVRLVVRLPDDPLFSPPQGGWTYSYGGNAVSNAGPNALDGTWNHDNGSDSWSGDGRGTGVGLLGGVSSLNGVLTVEDAVVSGTSSVDNRRYYFTHNLLQELSASAGDAILDNGVTLSFRARLTPPPPADPLTELTNAPNGFVNVLDGKGMFGMRQAGANGLLISFSLGQAIEDTSVAGTFNFGQAGLHMNNLNGDLRSAQVDPGDGGMVNVLPLDPTQFHEFWITISDNGSAPGTHRVSIYVDGNTTPTAFNVTAGSGLDAPYTNYIAMGLPSTGQRGAFDVDFFAYKAGVIVPSGLADPVQIVTQPTNQLVSQGQTASFKVEVIGTAPFAYQWYRDGALIIDATNSIYTTAPVIASDNGARFVVIASNLYGAATSAPPAVLNLLVPPTIVSQPTDLTVTNGSPASFNVGATSSAAISHQWRFNGIELTGETNATLSIASASPSHAGGYDVIASNFAGSTTSRVAVLTVRVLDFGDAPAPYPSLRASNGAHHVVVSGIRLGAAVDFELDGAPESAAQGDDLAGSDDEDGVSFTSPLRVGQVCMVEVVASTQGVLNAWIDFDRNGSWLGAGEQIFTNRSLVAGTNQLVFPVPLTAIPGASFARFRFGTTAGLAPGGPAPDGEVEDYGVVIGAVADLAVTMTDSPDPVAVGSNLVYGISVMNLGPSPATGVTLVDTLPLNVVFITAVPSTGTCVQIAGAVHCDFGTVAAGSGVTVSISVAPNISGPLINAVSVSANEPDLNPANNSVTATTTVEAAATIVTQPVSLVVTQGNTAVFIVAASGTPPLSYQWRLQSTNLPGQTAPTLTILNAQPANAGSYTVTVSNRVGQAQSAPATLTVLQPPSISQHPASATNTAGSTAVFGVIATGTAPLTYQWHFNDNPVAGGTGASLTLANVQRTNAGNYKVVVANSAGAITSAVALLTVLELDFGDAPDGPYPTLLASDGARHVVQPGVRLGTLIDIEANGQPGSGAVGDDANGLADEDGIIFRDALLAGQPVRIDVIASTNGFLNAWFDFAGNGTWSNAGDQIFTNRAIVAGTNALVFQIPGTATTSSTFARFRFSTVSGLGFTGAAQDGEVEDYAVRVGPAVQLALSIAALPVIATVGSNVTYQITVTNHGPSSANNVLVTDALPAPVTFVSALASVGSCTNEGGAITCSLGTLAASARATVTITAIANAEGMITNVASVASTDHELFAGDNTGTAISQAHVYPVIIQPPTSQSVTNGDAVTLTVLASGTAPNYQWSLNGTNIAGATNSSYFIGNAQLVHAGAYVVTVSNAVGRVASPPAQLTVLVPPVIVTQPQSMTVIAGSSASFAVGASGTQPLSYQWFQNGGTLSGQTGATLFIANAQPGHEGAYLVVVSNEAGVVQSIAATLTVLVRPQIVTQPQGGTNFAGSTATLTAAATGTEPLAYRWFFNQTNLLPDATSPVLNLPNVQTTDSGTYHVVVTNTAGSTTSQLASLTVRRVDFGDAPDIGYPTLVSFNGAHHFIAAGVHLGSQIDFEPDGLPNASASGDDLDNVADEDGVIFSRWLVGQTGSVRVIASTNGFVAAWVDFNHNGTWSESGEQVLASVPVSAGTNLLSVAVPASALDGQTFARFRFSTAPGLLPDGPASDGEVEDYSVTIDPAVDLGVIASDDVDPISANSTLTYTLTITNRGPSVASAVRVHNTLPALASLINVVPSQGSCTNDGLLVICDVGALAVREAATIAITITPSQAGMITNYTSVSASEVDVNTVNNSTLERTTVVEPAPLFGNAAAISIPDGAAAALYPSTIFVSGVTATVEKVIVTLRHLTHVAPDDLDVLLVGPGGQRVLLMSDAGGRPGIENVTITFDDTSSLGLPQTGLFASETYRPTNYGTNDTFPAPAPSPPYASQLSAFRGTDPNGAWSLYMVDDDPQESGLLASGWEITFLTLERFGDVRVMQMAQPSPVAVGSNLTFIVTVTNQGPADVTGVQVTNILPATATLVSFSSTAGQCTNNGGRIECVLGPMTNGQSAAISVTVIPNVLGAITNQAFAGANELDFNRNNNASGHEVMVKRVNDLVLSASAAPEPLALGQRLTYSLIVSNRGPNAATDVLLRHDLPSDLVFAGASSSQGACTNDGAVVLCALGAINSGARVTLSILANPTQVGVVTARSIVSAYEIDLSPPDNERFVTSTIGQLPTFTLQPQSQVVAVFSNVSFTATATGSAPIALQWLFNGAPIPGATSTTLSIASLRPSHAGMYSVVASNWLGVVTSAAAQLQIDYPGYRHATIPLVSSLDRWRYNHQGVDLGAAWRAPAFDDTSWSQGQPLFGLEVDDPFPYPDVIRTPLPLLSTGGNFIITYYFRHPFSFNKEGVLLALVSSNLIDDGAAFYLNGTNVGSVRLPPPPILYSTLATGLFNEGEYDILQWPPGALLEGTNVLAVEVHQSGLGSSDVVLGSTLSALTVPVADLVVAHRSSPSPVAVGSNLVLLTVVSNAGPATATVIQVSQSWSGPANFGSAISTHGPCFFDGTNVNCTIASIPAGQSAQVTVTIVPQASGSIVSAISARAAELDLELPNNFGSAIAIVRDPPVIVVPPVSQTVTNGDSVVFSATVNSAGPVSLQWLQDGAELFDATNATLTISNVQISAAGNYQIRASNDVGVAVGGATLRVLARPTISAIADQSVDEDHLAGPLAFTIGDFETPPADLQLAVTSSNPFLLPVTNIRLDGSGANRTVILIPETNQFGTALISITVRDADGIAAIEMFELIVNSINDLPAISAVADGSTLEDAPFVTSVTVADVETTAEGLGITVVSSSQSVIPAGNVVISGLGGTRDVTVTPLPNQFGSSLITLTVTDGQGGTASSSFVLTVVPVNDAPEISGITDRATDEDVVITVQFGISDAETAADALLLSLGSSNETLLPLAGMTLEGSGALRTLRLIPARDQSGVTTVTLRVDDSGASNNITTTTFNLRVNSVNDLPTISDIAAQEINEDGAMPPIPLIIGDVETSAAQLTLNAGSSNPDLIPVANVLFGGTGSNRTVTVVPVTNGFGSAIVSVTVSDSDGGMSTDSFVVTVASVNESPVIEPIADQITDEDVPAMVVLDVRDPETRALSFAFTSLNPDLLPVNNIRAVDTGTNWVLILTPVSNATGSAMLDLVVSDPEGLSVRASFELTVVPVNDPPSISDIPNQTTSEDKPVSAIPFTVSDIDTAASNLIVTASSSDSALLPPGSFAVSGSHTNRSLAITPAANQSGVATVILTVSDGQATAVDSFVLTVTPVNDPPSISDIANVSTPEDTPVGPLPFTLADVDTALDALIVSSFSSNPALVSTSSIVMAGTAANRTITLTPEPNQTGSSIIFIVARDPGGAGATNSFMVTVNSVDDAPFISEITDQSTAEDTVATLSFQVGDPENASAALAVTAHSSNVGLLPDSGLTLSGSESNRTLRMVPTANQFGATTITLSVTDTNGATSSRSFVLNVIAVNDLPAIATVADQFTDEDVPVAVPILVSDIETPAADLTLSPASSNSGLVPPANITFSGNGTDRVVNIAPAHDQYGVADITLTLHDASGGMTAMTFRLTVGPSNDLPTITAIADLTVSENSTIPPIGFVIGDAETPSTNLTLVVNSSNPALLPAASILLNGSGSNRTVTLNPISNQSGSAQVTLTVYDADGGSATEQFTMSVNPVNDPPSISPLANQGIAQDSLLAVPVVMFDAETAPADLVVSAVSSDSALVPPANLVWAGIPENRILRITPAGGATGSVTITVTATDAASASTSRSFVLTITQTAEPPTIVAQPQSQVVSNGVPVVFSVSAVGTAPLQYQWRFNGSNLSAATSSTLTINNAQPANAGLYSVLVSNAGGSVASDSATLVVTSSPLPPAVTLISTGAVWKYLDTGTNLGTTWRSLTFNDAAWAAGPAELGYGDAVDGRPEATVVSFGPDANNKYVTTYFRRSFDVPDPSVYTNLVLSLLRDDGAVVYLNAVEIFRSNMPTGAVSFTTLASAATPDETNFVAQNISPSALAPGTNVVAVEIHQNSVTSSDISFDFGLVGHTRETPPGGGFDIPNQNMAEDVPLLVPFSIPVPETTPFHVVATSSNQGLIPNTNLFVSGTGTNRTLLIVPSPDLFGSGTITVSITNETVSLSDFFTVTIAGVNDVPTLTPINDYGTSRGAGQQTIILSGITSGAGNESQTLSVTAISSDTSRVNPTISYTNGNTTGFLRFTPPNNNNAGTATVTVTVDDGGSSNSVVSRSFVVYVRANNTTPPTISSIADQTVNEDTSTPAIGFTVGDSSTPAASLTLKGISSNPALVAQTGIIFGGSGANRTVTVTPAPNAFGTATITVTVADSQFGIASVPFLLTVTSVNDVPSLSAIPNQTIGENSFLLPVGFTLSDADTPPAAITVTPTSSNAGLIPVSNITIHGLGTNRSVSAKPVNDQIGVSTITLTANDGAGGTAARSFTLTVTNRSNPPTISDIPNQSIPEKSVLTGVPFVIGDFETPAAALTLSASSSNPALAPAANITFAGSGTNRALNIEPVTNQFGSALITVTVTDAEGLTASDSFRFTVTPENDPPTLDPLADLLLRQGTLPQTISLAGIGSGSPAESQQLAVSAVSSNPTLVPHPVVSYSSPATTGSLLLSPNPATNGTAVITVTVNDGEALVSRTFTVTVDGLPLISAISDQAIVEDSSTAAIAFTVSDAETPAADLILTAASSNPALVPAANVVISGVDSNRLAVVTPVANESGVATITISATDTNGGSASESFVLVVNSINDPPTLAPLVGMTLQEGADPQSVPLSGITSGAANENQELLLRVSSDNPALFAGLAVQYTSPSSAGLLNFALDPAASGIANVTVSVTDRQRDNDVVSRSFVLTVIPNTPPSISEIADAAIMEDTPLGPVPLSIGDAETALDGLALSAFSSNPALIDATNVVFGGSGAARTFTLWPVTNAYGTSVVTIVVRDARGATASDSFILSVAPTNDAPIISAIADRAIDEDDWTGPIPFIVGDAETPASDLAVSFTSSNTEVIERFKLFEGSGSNRSLTLWPHPNRYGTSLITVWVRDMDGGIASQSFMLTVNPLPDPPVISLLPDQFMDEDGLLSVSFGVQDWDEPANLLTVTAVSLNTALVANTNLSIMGEFGRNLIIRPSPNRFGTGVITLTVVDTTGLSATNTFVLRVAPVNDPPVISAIPDQVINVNASTAPLPFIVSDVDDPATNLVMTAHSAQPSLVAVTGVAFSGVGGNRTLTVTPVADQFGCAPITLTVTDGSGATAISSFEVLVNQTSGPPVIAIQPQAQTVLSGSEVMLRVVATGPGTLIYQWRRSGTDLPGKTNATLVLSNAQPGDNGDYSVLVSNAEGSVLSDTARLQVVVLPRLTITRAGATATISFITTVGQSYILEYKNSLLDSSWTQIGSTVSGTGDPMAVSEPIPEGASRFYRVRTE